MICSYGNLYYFCIVKQKQKQHKKDNNYGD